MDSFHGVASRKPWRIEFAWILPLFLMLLCLLEKQTVEWNHGKIIMFIMRIYRPCRLATKDYKVIIKKQNTDFNKSLNFNMATYSKHY